MLLVCFSGFLVAVSRVSSAHDGEEHDHKPRQVKPAEMFAPSNLPDRVVLTFCGDPRTTQAVTWRSSMEIHKGIAEIAVATHGPEFTKQARVLEAVTVPLVSDLNSCALP